MYQREYGARWMCRRFGDWYDGIGNGVEGWFYDI